MPWKSFDLMSLRLEFVTLALAEKANVRELCRRFGLTARTGYKWIRRFQSGGPSALADRSRRPLSHPRLTAPEMTARVLELREKHPAWGGLKIHQRLLNLGHAPAPSPSTVTQILRRHGKLIVPEGGPIKAFQRFEHAAPNDLWQLDFKGHFALAHGRCHPLTAVDDHSRYALIVAACANEQGPTVRAHLAQAFQRCGLPWRILADNAGPWGSSAGPDCFTTLGVWLMRLGIQLIHGRPFHPQTQGKEERFNRTLKAEVLSRMDWRDLPQCEGAFETWRDIYNYQRPHQAIGLKTPSQLYRSSPRSFPKTLPPIEYGPGDIVKTVKSKGEITHANQFYYIGRAFSGLPVALRPTTVEGLLEIYFCQQKIGRIDLQQKAQSKWTYQSVRE
jgi:transposase InsO family protein